MSSWARPVALIAADVTAAIDAITAATVGPDPEDAEFVPDPAACEAAATRC